MSQEITVGTVCRLKNVTTMSAALGGEAYFLTQYKVPRDQAAVMVFLGMEPRNGDDPLDLEGTMREMGWVKASEVDLAIANMPLVREAAASCSLDGETQSVPDGCEIVSSAELAALRQIAIAVDNWHRCKHGDICPEIAPALPALGKLGEMGCDWLPDEPAVMLTKADDEARSGS